MTKPFICPHCQHVHEPSAPCIGSSKLPPEDPPARAVELLRSLCFAAERYMEYSDSGNRALHMTKAWKELHEEIEAADEFLDYYARAEMDREERRDAEITDRRNHGTRSETSSR